MASTLRIAATRQDWISLFQKVDGDNLLRFYRMSVFSLEEVIPQHIENIPGLGDSRRGILVQEDSLLALPTAVTPTPREIRQNNGVIRYLIDEESNPDSLILTPGGVWNDDFFVVGSMFSFTDTGVLGTLAKKMRGIVQRKFHSEGFFRVGPDCYSRYSRRFFTTDYRYEKWVVEGNPLG